MRNLDIQECQRVAQLIKKKHGYKIPLSAVFDELFLMQYNMFKDEPLNELIKEILKE
jgi:hypothetical protein